jgi:hypothetical protein
MPRPTSIQYRPTNAIPTAVSTSDAGAGVCGKEEDPGPMAIPSGLTPTPTVATTVFEDVSITETLLLIALTTYTRVPAGFMDTPVSGQRRRLLWPRPCSTMYRLP